MGLDRSKVGRKPGVPNKATTAAREAIAAFVDGNAHHLEEWLQTVANGVKRVNPETGEEEYLIPPNPARAFDMFQSVVEYHVPKLARMEVAGDKANPLEVNVRADVFGELLKNLKMQRQHGGG
jgi:hypothetical protein